MNQSSDSLLLRHLYLCQVSVFVVQQPVVLAVLTAAEPAEPAPGSPRPGSGHVWLKASPGLASHLPHPGPRWLRPHLFGNGSEQTGRVPSHHLPVQTQTGQVLVHVDKVLLEAFLHPANGELSTASKENLPRFGSSRRSQVSLMRPDEKNRSTPAAFRDPPGSDTSAFAWLLLWRSGSK